VRENLRTQFCLMPASEIDFHFVSLSHPSGPYARWVHHCIPNCVVQVTRSRGASKRAIRRYARERCSCAPLSFSWIRAAFISSGARWSLRACKIASPILSHGIILPPPGKYQRLSLP
jgi:hypothetical protein